jgi:hypothetical protein
MVEVNFPHKNVLTLVFKSNEVVTEDRDRKKNRNRLQLVKFYRKIGVVVKGMWMEKPGF